MLKYLKLKNSIYLVIGGGFIGCGLIRDLAMNGGVKVGLIDQGDFASGTSSTPSKLIHGGFRYLLNHDLALVSEAYSEREVPLRIVPGLVKPLPVVILNYIR